MEDIVIGLEILSIPSGSKAVVIDKTANSINVKIFKTNPKGIDCTGWVELSWFNRKYQKA